MTSSTRVILDPKRVAEVVTRLFDFTSKCGPNDVLSAPVITVTVWSGVDGSPASVYAGSTTIAGQLVSPRFTGGLPGVIYLIQVQVTSNGTSPTLELDALLAVLPVGM